MQKFIRSCKKKISKLNSSIDMSVKSQPLPKKKSHRKLYRSISEQALGHGSPAESTEEIECNNSISSCFIPEMGAATQSFVIQPGLPTTVAEELTTLAENNLANVTYIINYFETKSATLNKSKINHKRSQLTRKVSNNLIDLHSLPEETQRHGDCLAQESLLNQSETKKNEKPEKDPALELVLHLLSIYSPKSLPKIEAQVYTVDNIQYKVKTNQEMNHEFEMPTSLFPKASNPHLHLPRCATTGNDMTEDWTERNVEDSLNYARTAAKNMSPFFANADKNRSEVSLISTTKTVLLRQPPMLRQQSNFQTSDLELQKDEISDRSISNAELITFNIPRRTSQFTQERIRGIHAQHRNYIMPLSRQNVTDGNNNERIAIIASSSTSEESQFQSISFRESEPPRRQPEYSGSNSQYSAQFRHLGHELQGHLRDRSPFSRNTSVFSSAETNAGASCAFRSGISELSQKTLLIEDATHATSILFGDLKLLRLILVGKKTITTRLPASDGEHHRLLELTRLCSYVVKEIENDWQSSSSTVSKVDELTRVNNSLHECLSHAKQAQAALRSEIKYLEREKEMITAEVKALSMQLVEKKQAIPQAPIGPKRDKSTTSFGFNVSKDTTDKRVQNREEDFNSLMDVVLARGSDRTNYQAQLEKYETEVVALQKQIEMTQLKQLELERMYAAKVQENQSILRERSKYESVLNLILQEKKNGGSSLHGLLETLIATLNSMNSSSGEDIQNSAASGLMDGVMQAMQEQNSNLREELQHLQETLSNVSPNCLSGKCLAEANKSLALSYERTLEEKNEKMKQIEIFHEDKYSQLQQLHDVVTQSKAKLEKSYAEKDHELRKTKDNLRGFEKTNLRQQKKIQDLQKLNLRLAQDVNECKHNMESLNSLVYQLRSTLDQKNSQYSDRIRTGEDEVIEAKGQCKWLQSQVEELTKQLADAHERMKGHERDKACLAEQVMSAEEERKVVDRKLLELRAALQGDSVLREALMERNDALQVEINRLRRAKLMSLDMNMKGSEGLEHEHPPSEMSTVGALSPFSALPPTSTAEENHGHAPKKNLYTASGGHEEPRIVSSMHSPSDRSK